jgi:hypothetical protein
MSEFIDSMRSDRNNLSFWFPKVKSCGFLVPETVIVPVPDEVIRAFFMEEEGDRERVAAFVRGSVMPALEGIQGLPFIKNGTYSDKFDFRNCCPPDREEETILRSILQIEDGALCTDAGGCAEVVLRERIPCPADTPTIYHGLPLQPEFRLFYDFDAHVPLYVVNYWDSAYCSAAIRRHEKDAKAYGEHYPHILENYKMSRRRVVAEARKKLADVEGLEGIWSVDFLLDSACNLWLIDMAEGYRSAYWDPAKATLAKTASRITRLFLPAARPKEFNFMSPAVPFLDYSDMVNRGVDYFTGLDEAFIDDFMKAVSLLKGKDSVRAFIGEYLPEGHEEVLAFYDRLIAWESNARTEPYTLKKHDHLEYDLEWNRSEKTAAERRLFLLAAGNMLKTEGK